VVGTKSLAEMIQKAVEGASESTSIDYGGVTMNIYGAEGQDIHALADEIEERLVTGALRRRAAFGSIRG